MLSLFRIPLKILIHCLMQICDEIGQECIRKSDGGTISVFVEVPMFSTILMLNLGGSNEELLWACSSGGLASHTAIYYPDNGARIFECNW